MPMGSQYSKEDQMNISHKPNTPVGYSLIKIDGHEAAIEEILKLVRAKKLTLRKAASELSEKLDRKVSYEWVRQAVLTRGKNDNE
jgi:hypothetical protein